MSSQTTGRVIIRNRNSVGEQCVGARPRGRPLKMSVGNRAGAGLKVGAFGRLLKIITENMKVIRAKFYRGLPTA